MKMTKVERHMDICKGLNEIYEQKNHDYGDSFHDTFVEEGMAMARIRLSDKLNRFKKLSKADSEQKVNDESIRDTLLDLANYAIMTVMEVDILAEEEARTKIRKAIIEHRKAYLPKNVVDSGEEFGKMVDDLKAIRIPYTCPVCRSLMTFEKELDKYVCENCGATYEIKASNGKPDTDPDPCKKCAYPGKVTCLKNNDCGCVDRIAWEKRQRSDTNAAEAE